MSVLWLAGAIVLFVLALPVVLVAAGTWRLAQSSRRYSRGQATITKADVRSNRRATGLPGYSLHVRYEYRVGRTDYCGRVVTAFDLPYATRKWAARRVAEYPVGRSVTVMYDARDPEIAVLEAGWRPECWFPIVLAIVMLAGSAACMVVALSRSTGLLT